MQKRFFKLTDDVYLSGRWELGHPLDQEGRKLEDPWQFRIGQRAHPDGHIRIPIKISGTPLDYSHAAFSIPVVHARVASLFTELAPDDVQLIPVEIDSQPAQHFILNATRRVKCIDDATCEEVRYWTPEDGMPEKVGTYSSVSGMRIDTAKVGEAKVFRTWGWTVALIVSEELKEALERAGISGVKFKDVTGPGATPGLPDETPRST
ncbi:imm11 family protein [Corallococcus sp. 4LFB]|uniref:imm11 family protein n=1 Tax=Corallococcus sp. 4LFB TaxID=3383249 RepID=UPI003976885E